MEQNQQQSGFTLIEILVVLGIFIFIASFALVVSMDSYHGYNFRTEQDLLLGVLQKARSQAVANVNQKPHGVFLDASSTQYTLFQGTDYSHRDTSFDLVFKGNSGYSLSGTTSTVFTQLSGTTTPATVTLDDHTHPIFNICINSEGQINAKTTCP